jgi:hypothetical protein
MCSSPPAGLAGHLFDNSHKTIAPARQPRPYIRSCELRSVVESAHRNIARKTKGWIKHKIRHIALTRDGQSLFRRARSPNVCAKTFLRPGVFQGRLRVSNTSARTRGNFPPAGAAYHSNYNLCDHVACWQAKYWRWSAYGSERLIFQIARLGPAQRENNLQGY